MEASILIVSKNRKQALENTLLLIKPMLDLSKHEVLVFLDGCTDGSMDLMESISWVRWCFVETGIGASPARHYLYPKATGQHLFGFDDDAHPLYSNFIARTVAIFNKHPQVGIIAFEEIKGLFKSDAEALQSVDSQPMAYLTNEFIGCGFAIKKSVYDATNGFPVWMAIYGEESCLSIEVLSKGYAILFTNAIKVNHRVDKAARKQTGNNYFRFEQQLKNTTWYYMVYYKKPIFKILKLYWHNFKKYALTDFKCFTLFFKVMFQVVLSMPSILKYRKPVNEDVIKNKSSLRSLKY